MEVLISLSNLLAELWGPRHRAGLAHVVVAEAGRGAGLRDGAGRGGRPWQTTVSRCLLRPRRGAQEKTPGPVATAPTVDLAPGLGYLRDFSEAPPPYLCV